MRSFIVASLILIIMTGLIISNSCYVIKKTDELISLSEKVKNDSSAIDELISSWQNCRNIFGISVVRTEIDNADEALCCLTNESDRDDFLIAICRFRRAVEHIANAQKPTADNIF